MNRIATDSTIKFSHLGERAEPPVIVDLMNRALENPELLSLAAGFTDNAVLPREQVATIASEVAMDAGDEDCLQYGQNQGRRRLRELSASWLGGHPSERADRLKADDIFITNGSQQGLYLALQSLCDAGDIVLVEDPSYFVCLEVMRGLGIQALGIPCDDAGAVQLDKFAELVAQLQHDGRWAKVKAVYIVSYFGNPSSRSMELDEKLGIAKVLQDSGGLLPIIEDAAYRELYFQAPHSVPSVLSLDAFSDFPKLYLGTYTKPFATGLKVGFAYCTDPEWRQKMLCLKGHQDFGTAHFNQAILERALASGVYADHLSRIQKHYAAKAEVIQNALVEGGLSEAGWQWERPKGGLIFWLRGPDDLDARTESDFCQSCIRKGVLYVPGDLCFASRRPWNCVRLSTGALPEHQLVEAVSRFTSVAIN